MIAIAVPLLPALGLLLYGMDHFEERLFGKPASAHHTRDRHPRLISVQPGRRPRTGAPPVAASGTSLRSERTSPHYRGAMSSMPGRAGCARP